ncbi:MAG: IS4 family transposase [Bacteroidales bacterium]
MLQSKDINKISELKNGFTPRWLEPDFILSSLTCFSFSSACKSLNPLKKRGYSFETVFSCLITLPFLGVKSVNAFAGSALANHIKARKDVFYRLKNSSNICWRLILWMFSMKFIKLVKEKSTSIDGTPKCLIIDDSMLEKTGRYMEKVSRMFDHVSKRFLLGFKLLTMGYWDGITFIPLDFSLHREKGTNANKPFGLKKKEYKKQYRKIRGNGSYNDIRAKEADMSKIESALKMFWHAISQGLKVDYILMDSWFTCDAFIKAVKRVKKQTVHLIGMYKTPKTKFDYMGEKLTHSQIRNKLGKAKRCRKLKLYYKEASVCYNDVDIKIYFSRKGTNGKWRVFITTDTELSFIRMIEIYQIRWTIEVFFKESKQLLGLGRCQSNDFDAQIADITITMIQHILLTLKYRFETYESKGALFDQVKEDIIQYRLDERIWGLFIELIKVLEVLFDEMDEMELLEKVMRDERALQLISKLIPDAQIEKNAA